MDRKKNSKGAGKDEKHAPKLTKAKVKALELISKYPDKSLMEIGRELNKLQLIPRPEHIYNLTRSDRDNSYMQTEISKIREKNLEMMSREIVPEALKIHKRLLKNKKIPDLKKKDWVSMAEKAEFGVDDSKRPIRPVTVNIEHLQAIMAASFNITKDDKDNNADVIDIKPEQDKHN